MKCKARLFTFEAKVTAMVIAIILAVTACTAVFIALVSGAVLKEAAVDNCGERLNAISNRFDVILSRIQAQTSLLTLHKATHYETYSQEAATPYEALLRDAAFSSYLAEYLATQPSVDSIAYYDRENASISKDTYGAVNPETFSVPLSVRDAFLRSNVPTLWYVQPRAASQAENYLFFCLKKSYSFSGDLLGMFTIMVAPKEIRSIYQGSVAPGEIFLVSDDAGTICACSEERLAGYTLEALLAAAQPSNGSVVELEGASYLYTTRGYPEAGLQLALLTPTAAVYRQSYLLFQLVVLLGALFVTLAILISRRYTRRLLRPLGEIISSVRRMSAGRYDVRIPVQAEDELGRLSGELNAMAENTQQLLGRIQSESEQKHRFELSYLQVQMQPHFLYNTLETVCGMIDSGEREESIELIHQISSFYRAVLNKGQEVVPLSQEMEITRSYLRIMQTRYAGEFQFALTMDPAAQDCPLPKMTLQPFVENAVVHGFIGYHAEEEKLLAIVVAKQPGSVSIRIEDNGAGMAPDVLARLGSAFPASSRSFGVDSVRQRLRLYFGQAAQVSLWSAPGAGTRVEISIPDRLLPPAGPEEHK